MGRGTRLELFDCRDQTFYVFGTREPVIAVLDQRQYDVVAGKARYKFNGVPPGHVRIFDTLQNLNRAARLEQPAEQQEFAAVLDQRARDRIRLFIIR